MSERARYRVIRPIGAGGMGQVLEAVARGRDGFERRVAMKVMRAELADGDGDAGASFIDEAKIASHLHHANIVQVLDYGVLEGAEFIVFEYVDGVDMWRAAQERGGTAPATVALYVVQEIAYALDHAHRRTDIAGRPLGIIHRDVTPSNMLVSWDGDVKLSDFGIAYAQDRSAVTAVGTLRGKATYVSPEQMAGARPTPAVDIFALGVSLAGLVGGAPVSQLGQRIVRPLRGIDEDIAALCERCLDPTPSARPDARELAVAANALRQARTREGGRLELTEWLAGVTRAAADEGGGDTDAWSGRQIVADENGQTFRLQARPSPPRRVAGWGAVAVVLGLGLGGAGLLASQRSPEPPSQAALPRPPESTRPAPRARPAPESEPKAEPEAASSAEPEPEAAPPPTERPPRARPAPPPAPRRKGTLTLGGAKLLRGWVEIDGEPLEQQAPLRLSLPVGAHRIVVRAKDGALLLDRRVRLEARHTAVEPLRIIER